MKGDGCSLCITQQLKKKNWKIIFVPKKKKRDISPGGIVLPQEERIRVPREIGG